MLQFEWELLLIHRHIVFQMESVFVFVAPSQVRFRHSDHFSVLLEQAEVLSFVLVAVVGHVQVGFVGDFLVGHEPFAFWSPACGPSGPEVMAHPRRSTGEGPQ